MKKNILLLVVSFLFFTAANARYRESNDEQFFFTNQTHFYAKFLSGVNFLQNSTTDGNKATFKAGYIISGSLGYCCFRDIRLELEYAFRKNAIKKIDFYIGDSSCYGHFQNSSCMANLLWNIPLSSQRRTFWHTQPFIGGGLGGDFQRIHSSNSRIIFHQKWHNLSWQATAGLTCLIGYKTGITVEYKFHQGRPHFYNHYAGIGLVYKFGSLRL